MNTNAIILKLKRLTDEGESLIEKGYEIPADTCSEICLPVIEWILKCNNLLTSIYGKNSSVFHEFHQAYTLRMSVNMLLSLAAKLHVSGESCNL